MKKARKELGATVTAEEVAKKASEGRHVFTVEQVEAFEAKQSKKSKNKNKGKTTTAPARNGTYSASDIQATKAFLDKVGATKAKALIGLMG